MFENSIVGEVIEYFRVGRSWLEEELAVKEKSHQNTVFQASELLLVSIWQNPLKPVLRRFLPRKIRKLKKKIANLKKRIECCVQAETDLGEKKYKSAILLLDEMINSSPATIPATSMVPNLEGTAQTQMPNPQFQYLLDLRQKLNYLQDGKAEATIQ